jgi:hypothetical protein
MLPKSRIVYTSYITGNTCPWTMNYILKSYQATFVYKHFFFRKHTSNSTFFYIPASLDVEVNTKAKNAINAQFRHIQHYYLHNLTKT